VEQQRLDTRGAFDCAHFEIDGVTYLAVANHRDPSYETDSVVYRWNDTATTWVEHQRIRTIGGLNWEFFAIGGASDLAIANYNTGSSYQTESVVYRWNMMTTMWVEHRQIETNRAYDWEYFEKDGTSHLTGASSHGASSAVTDSIVYRWNASTTYWEEQQRLETRGTRCLKNFQANGLSYLAVGNFGTSFPPSGTEPVIYRRNMSLEVWTEHQQVETRGASGC